MKLSGRFPPLAHVLQVFSVIVFIIYAWTLLGAFRLVAVSWVLFMSLGDILSLVAYQLVTALLECLLVLAALLVVAAILPKDLLRDRFVSRGTVVAGSFLGTLIGYYQFFLIQDLYDKAWYWLVAFTVLCVILLVASSKIKAVESFFASAADRSTVFLYLLMPITVLSIGVVLARNL